MKYFWIILVFISGHAFSQGYGIDNALYPREIKKTSTKFWKREVKRIQKKIRKDSTNSELFYALALAEHYSNGSSNDKLLKHLDRAISMDSTIGNYFLVRGIVKINRGGYSFDYDATDGCIDIKKGLEYGTKVNTMTNEEISDLYDWCDMHYKKEPAVIERNPINHTLFEGFDVWIRTGKIEKKDPFPTTDETMTLQMLESKILISIFDGGTASCDCQYEISNNYFKATISSCKNEAVTIKNLNVPRFAYGFISGENLSISFINRDFEIKANLYSKILGTRGWMLFEKM